MSWMDSWSRPAKSQATPAPFYLLPGGESTPYCHSCGRVVGTRKTTAAASANTPAKYCSSRCRNQKPGKLDREIEHVFVRFLKGEDGDGEEKEKEKDRPSKGGAKRQKKVKGDSRILVACTIVEDSVFGHGGADGHSARSNSAEPETDRTNGTTPAGGPGGDEDDDDDDDDDDGNDDDPHPEDVMAGSVDPTPHVDGDVLARMSVRSGTRIRPPQSVSEVNGSVGGEKGRAERVGETDEMLEKRRRGQRRAREREMVRCAARRGVAFGFLVDGDGGPGASGGGGGGGNEKTGAGANRRLCEAVMAGKVVEPSYAKGDWSIRWRE